MGRRITLWCVQVPPPRLLMSVVSGGEYHQSYDKDDDDGDESDFVHRSSMCLVRNRPIPIAPSPKIRSVSISAVSIVQIYNINLTSPNGGEKTLGVILPPFLR